MSIEVSYVLEPACRSIAYTPTTFKKAPKHNIKQSGTKMKCVCQPALDLKSYLSFETQDVLQGDSCSTAGTLWNFVTNEQQCHH